jgi:hypothetical protein
LKPTALLIELHYLPCVQYFAQLAQHPIAYIEQWEHYQKGSYRNRCHIAGANGLLRLSVPLQKGKNEQQPIRAVRIAYKEPWPAQHWGSIQSAYGKAPYFEHYAEHLQPLFEARYELLFDFSFALLLKLAALLQLDCELRLTERYAPTPAAEIEDARDAIHPKKPRWTFTPQPYPQIFSEKHGFLPNLSALDLLFCAGPEAPRWIASS